MSDSPSIFLALPRRKPDDPIPVELVRNCSVGGVRLADARARHDTLLSRNFNALWAEALNRRGDITHFAMLHNDVAPEPGWLDTLVREMQLVGADLVSAVCPLKDTRGLTSTAVYDPGANTLRRLSVSECGRLPATFDGAQARGLFQREAPSPEWLLLVNTGCWVCRFAEPWVEEAWFEERNRIVRRDDGKFEAQCMPEDWTFSLRLGVSGLRVFATTAVKLAHHGDFGYPNHGKWGLWETDRQTGEVFEESVSLVE